VASVTHFLQIIEREGLTMALVKCPECSREVSDAANCCPHCGYPLADNLYHISDNGANDILQEDKIDNNNVDTSVGADTKQKTKLYQKTWFAFVMLFVFFPVGCFLIWKYKKANLPVRIISSVICGLPFLFWVFIFIVLLIPCEHEWNAPTCERPMTCKICGETSGQAAEHKWKAATCSVPKTCTVCQATEGSKLSHSFTSKVATNKYLCKAATKDSPATYYYSCSKCQTKGTETFTSGQRLMDSWGYNYYIDYQFGEKTDEWFVKTHELLDGTFENSATDGAELLAEILYDCNDEITIFLYEYGDEDNLVKNSSSSYKDYYKIVVKNEDGDSYEARGQMWPGGDRIYVIDTYHSEVLKMMQTSETIKFFIQSEDSPTTQYRFEVDMNNFNDLVEDIK
jgi:hypothetical protein